MLGLVACDDGGGEQSDAAHGLRPTPVPSVDEPLPPGQNDQPNAAVAPAADRPAVAPAVAEGELAERVTAAEATIVAEHRLSLCAKGIEFLVGKIAEFQGPRADRDLIRAGIDTGAAAHAIADSETCLDALTGPFAALGYGFEPGPREPVPCVRGIHGAVAMLDDLDGDTEAQTRAYLFAAVTALEAGDLDLCVRALGEALWVIRDAQ